jgi:hypothetical protein
MSVNKRLPHVHVLPEDDANKDIANGFKLELELDSPFRVLSPAGGWRKVLDSFIEDHATDMARYSTRFMVLLIDFDNDRTRLDYARTRIPEHLADRVFIVGAFSEPEKLKSDFPGKSLESIGQDAAKDCRNNTEGTWASPLLRHNAAEVARLNATVRPILFPDR